MSSSENTQSESAVPSGAGVKEIETLLQKMATVEKNLTAETKRVQRSTRITAVVGVICLGLLAGYFYYGYSTLERYVQPKAIVGMADGLLVGQLPIARQALEKEVNDSADTWAAQLSKQAYDGIPVLRKEGQVYLLEKIDAEIAENVTVPEEEFRTFLRNNHDTLELQFKELAHSEELADASLEELQSLLDQKLGYGVRQRATDLLAALVLMNTRLEDLRKGGNLGLEGQLERQIVMICKRLQIQEQGPGLEEGLKEIEKEAARSLLERAAGDTVPDSNQPATSG